VRALALLALAACAGRTAEPAPATATAPAPAPDLEAELARIDALGDQVCACADEPCLEEADRAVGAYLDVGAIIDPITGEDPWPAALAPRYEAATRRVSDCFEAAEFFPPETNDRFTLRRFERAADHACACTDDACRVALRDRLHVLDDDRLFTFPSQTSVDRLLAASARLARCLGPALDDAIAEALAAFGPMRDQACACADVACAQGPTRAYLVWVTSRGALGTVLLTVGAVRDVTTEMNACVGALR
jgi:hypothetical protein